MLLNPVLTIADTLETIMKKYIITIINQIETLNIKGIQEDIVFHVLKAYYNEETNVKLGGKIFSFKKIKEIAIHEFENEESLDNFFEYVKVNNLKKISIIGDYYFDIETIEKFSKTVTNKYLTLEKENKSSQNSSKEENQEILQVLKEITERLSKIELGQQIIYDDLRDDLEEVKELIGKTSKKNLKQLIIGKLVDAGLGTLTSAGLEAIKDFNFKAIL